MKTRVDNFLSAVIRPLTITDKQTIDNAYSTFDIRQLAEM